MAIGVSLGVLALAGGLWWSRTRSTTGQGPAAGVSGGTGPNSAGVRAPETRAASGEALRLRVQPGAGPGVHVAGKVSYGGAPFAGAIVELRPRDDDDGPGLRTESGADGSFDLGVVGPASVEITASAPGKAPANQQVMLADPTRRPAPDALELVLGDCRASVYGTVIDVSGGAIARARLRFGAAIVESDDQGRYDRCLVVGERSSVVVSADGYGGVATSLEGLGRTRRDFALSPEATIFGRVVRAGDKSPVAGATVEASPNFAAPPLFPTPRRARTGEDGRFQITGLRPTTYYVAATAPGLRAQRVEEVTPTPGGASEITLEVEPATIVRGRVVAGGAPVPGVLVRVVDRPPDAEPTFSQADGTFVMELGGRDGQASLETWPHRLVTPVSVPLDGQAHDVVLEVTARATIAGRVVHEGKPVAGADVYCDRAYTSSQLDGSFELRGLEPGTYDVSGTSESVGAFADDVKVTVAAGERKDGVVVDLSLGGAIAGKVVDQAGAPMAGVKVRFSLIGGRDFGRSTTGPDGTFVARQLRGGGAYEAEVASATTGATLTPAGGTFAPIPVAGPKALVDGVVLRVRYAHKATSGRVVDAAGAPVPDVAVSLRRDSTDEQRWYAPAATTTSDGQGAFRFDDLDEGTYALTAQAADHRIATQRVVAGASAVVVRLGALGRIEGTLAGFDQPGVFAVGQGDRRDTWRNATVEGTTFKVTVAAGRYLVQANDRTGATASRAVVVPEGGVATVAFVNEGTGTITGRVIEVPGDKPVAEGRCLGGAAMEEGATIFAGSAEVVVGAGGTFTLKAGVGPGVVRCFIGRYTLGEARVNVVRGETAAVTVRVVREPEDAGGMLGVDMDQVHLITKVFPGTPAATAGIRVGETVTSVDGVATTGLGRDGVRALIARHAPGQVVELGLALGATARTVSVTMAARTR